jgi:hypothetical protein
MLRLIDEVKLLFDCFINLIKTNNYKDHNT